ncbi:MAG: ribosome small subunit-dependent GTPase A [Roseburia sp.]|nr:ribosome small subunit-dependent GTPase A [Roseburia sp.]
MKGKIVKGIAGFYYVHVTPSGIYECKAKGIFRKDKKKPLVGDDVELDILDEEEMEGNITEILPRKNELIRPAVANVDQALLVFAAEKPDPNYNLLDRFLVMMAYQQVPVTICFNKCDYITEKKAKEIASDYGKCGSRVMFISVKEERGLRELALLLEGKTSVLAGPSGVGKSSIVNYVQPLAAMETGSVSEKIGRGKNTTRHSELIYVKEDTYIMDTPGFSSLDIPGFKENDLWRYYPEFVPLEPECRFHGCSHIKEPDCGVKHALEKGQIPKVRYENYVTLYQELKQIKRY